MLILTIRGSILMNIRNKTGARTLPCWTPEVTMVISEQSWFTSTSWVLLERYFLTHLVIDPSAIVNWSFLIIFGWDTLVNDLEKSSRIRSMCIWRSIHEDRSGISSISAVTVDSPRRNPCGKCDKTCLCSKHRDECLRMICSKILHTVLVNYFAWHKTLRSMSRLHYSLINFFHLLLILFINQYRLSNLPWLSVELFL